MSNSESASGTFSIPDGLTLPSELAGPPPRPLPDFIYRSPLAQNRRNVFWGLLTVGCLCGILAPFPFVATLSLYILPLGYLNWIAGVLIFIALLQRVSGGEGKQACRYVSTGDTSFARVDSIVKAPTVVMNGQPTHYGLT